MRDTHNPFPFLRLVTLLFPMLVPISMLLEVSTMSTLYSTGLLISGLKVLVSFTPDHGTRNTISI
jgi:hypothetical protein